MPTYPSAVERTAREGSSCGAWSCVAHTRALCLVRKCTVSLMICDWSPGSVFGSAVVYDVLGPAV